MADETLDRPLRAGELARRAGVSKDTLRFYERKGLLPRPRRMANNYRAYPPETVDRVLWLRRVLAAGFTLDELARILALRESGGIPCRQVRRLISALFIIGRYLFPAYLQGYASGMRRCVKG